MYGIILTGILTGVVIASSEWVFAAPEDEIDYSFVIGNGIGILTCSDGSETEEYGASFQYSEKKVDINQI